MSEARNETEVASHDDCLVQTENVTNDRQGNQEGKKGHCLEKSNWEEKHKVLENQMKEIEIRMERLEKVSW